MNAILYLLRTKIKNYIKQLLKKPAALILYLVIFGLMVFSLSSSARSALHTNASVQWLLGSAGAALGTLTLLYPMFKGVSEGGTFFSMADVGLLFPSPVKPKKILIYGIINQMTTTLLMSVILLAQTSNLRMWFGLSLRGAFTVIAAALVLIYTINVASMLIYAICSANPIWRPRFTKIGRVCVAGIAAAILYAFMETLELSAAVKLLMNNAFLSRFPMIGWAKSVFEAADIGGVSLLLPMSGIVLFAVLVTVALTMVSADFYEDVLAATEKRQSQLSDKRAGRSKDITLFKRGFRLKMRGQGASAIFFRQLSEYARRGFFDIMTLTLILIVVIMRLGMGSSIAILGERFFLLMMAYMMMLFNMQGLWGRELQKPFIYLIPAKPLKKLAFATLLGPFKAFMDGALLSIVLIVFTHMPAWYLPAYALSAAGFSAVYTAGDILSRTILGDSKTRMVTMLIYILLSLILATPGGIFLFVFQPLWLGCIVCAAWCFGGAGIVMALCGRSIFEFQAGT